MIEIYCWGGCKTPINVPDRKYKLVAGNTNMYCDECTLNMMSQYRIPMERVSLLQMLMRQESEYLTALKVYDPELAKDLAIAKDKRIAVRLQTILKADKENDTEAQDDIAKRYHDYWTKVIRAAQEKASNVYKKVE